jgi:hypothetical protein
METLMRLEKVDGLLEAPDASPSSGMVSTNVRPYPAGCPVCTRGTRHGVCVHSGQFHHVIVGAINSHRNKQCHEK